MNTARNYGANAYASVGLETGVASASPHGLILMLFDGAIQAIINADQRMRAGDTPGKGKSISKAIEIIDQGLSASLDESVGGELTQSLKALYEYMCRRLVVANLKNDTSILTEVRKLLSELREAWAAIGKGGEGNIEQSATKPTKQPDLARRLTA